ncbi:MAG: hypothetical protein ACXIUM_07680 [Wenzhouxiangella sp.]
MRLTFIALLALSPVLACFAEASIHCGSTERFGTILIRSGDSERRVLQAGPDRTVRLETREGGAAGFRHDFYRHDVTIQVYVRAGVVTEICRVRE